MLSVSRLTTKSIVSSWLNRTVLANRRPHLYKLSHRLFCNNKISFSITDNTTANNLKNSDNNMQLNWGFNGTTTSPLLDDLSHAALQGNLEFITSKTDKLGEFKNSVLLGCAASGGHVSTIQFFLSQGFNVDALSFGRVTPLIEALKGHKLDAAKVLIENGASLTRRGLAPLHMATAIGSEELIKLILERGGNVNEKCDIGGALSCAFSPKIAKFLIEAGADVNMRDIRGDLPIHIATRRGIPEVVELLLDAGADLESKGSSGTPLYIAAQESNGTLMALLLSRGANINATNESFASPLTVSSINEYFLGVQLLLKFGANVEGHEQCHTTPLQAAVVANNMDCVKALVEAGANIFSNFGKDEYTPLSFAMLTGRKEIAFYLLEHINGGQTTQIGGNENDFFIKYMEGNMVFSESLFYKVCGIGHLELVKRMVETKKVDLNGISEIGNTPLTCAITANTVEVAEYLISIGADINKCDKLATPLFCAMVEPRLDMVALLLRCGVDLNQMCNGMTPLQWAFVRNYLTVAQELINAGASLDKKAENGFSVACFCQSIQAFEMLQKLGVDFITPGHEGHLAIQSFAEAGNLELVKKMLELGVDVNCCDQRGFTPIFSALPHIETFHYLLERGAKVDVITQGGNTILHSATAEDTVPPKVLEELIPLVKDKISINMRDGNSFTPFLIALTRGSIEKMRILAAAGADMKNVQDGDDILTVLHWAAATSKPDIIKTLVQITGLDVNVRANNGYNAGYYATNETIETLVELGIDFNIIGNSGDSALHLATEENNVEMVKIMLKGGANKDAKNAAGETPLDWAIKFNFPEVAEVLRNWSNV